MRFRRVLATKEVYQRDNEASVDSYFREPAGQAGNSEKEVLGGFLCKRLAGWGASVHSKNGLGTAHRRRAETMRSGIRPCAIGSIPEN